MSKKNIIVTASVFVVFVALFFLYSKNNTLRKNDYITIQGSAFGTLYHVIYEPVDEEQMDNVVSNALKEIDDALSMFNRKSIISRINAGDTTATTNDLFETVYKKSNEISEMTNGAFDITIAPVVNLWGFGFKKGMIPTDTNIDELMASVGYDKIHLVNHHIIKDNPNTMLDASAIAKGYACDYAAEKLKEHGISNFLVEIGGEVHAEGKNKQNNEWKVGINKPVQDSTCTNQEIERVVALSGRSLATSGNYRNFYTREGKRYAHTIDPKTGRPVEHNLLSATIIADDCMTADAIATACMVMGLKESMKLCSQYNIPGFFITSEDDDSFQCHYTDSFEPYLVISKD